MKTVKQEVAGIRASEVGGRANGKKTLSDILHDLELFRAEATNTKKDDSYTQSARIYNDGKESAYYVAIGLLQELLPPGSQEKSK